MVLNILIPELNNKPKNTKDAIISILARIWPLTLKSIYNHVKKDYSISCTYQSVYKASNELLEKGVLKKKKGKTYEIDIDWIKKVQSFTDIVETNYYAKKRLEDLSGIKHSKTAKDLIILNFKTLFDAEKYLYYFMKNELHKKRNTKVTMALSNEWRPLFYLRAEYNYYKKLIEKENKFYFLCNSNSHIEQLSRDFYQSIGVNYLTKSHSFPAETIVFGDYYIQIFIPKELRIKINECLEKKQVLKLLEECLEKNTEIKVVITKDASLAKDIEENIISNFN